MTTEENYGKKKGNYPYAQPRLGRSAGDSVRKGFTSDHSSTSYEFLAVDHPLSRGARNKVASLSSRANPTRRL